VAETAGVQFSKEFKWKKINYKTFLPKHEPIVAYIVAKSNNSQKSQYMMHAAAHVKEFDKRYTMSDMSRKLRQTGSRLTSED
jgi:hypothetical protein